nr:hypothetical protein [Tanacetum cinerariifolium]
MENNSEHHQQVSNWKVLRHRQSTTTTGSDTLVVGQQCQHGLCRTYLGRIQIPDNKQKDKTGKDNILEDPDEALKLAIMVNNKEESKRRQKLTTKERQASLVIGKEVDKEVEEGYVAQKKLKLKGIETILPAVQSLLNLKQGTKQRRHDNLLTKMRVKEDKRQASLVIGKEVDKEVEEGYVAQKKIKLKGIETILPAVQSLLNLKQGTKQRRHDNLLTKMSKGLGEGSSINPNIQDYRDVDSDETDSTS